MEVAILERKLNDFKTSRKLSEIDTVEKLLEANYADLKKQLLKFEEIYHYIFVFEDELDQEDLGIDVHNRFKEFIEKTSLRRNRKLLEQTKGKLRYRPIYKPYNFYLKKIMKLGVEEKLEYLHELFLKKHFTYSNTTNNHFSLDSEYSSIIFVNPKESSTYKLWFTNYYSNRLFTQHKNQFESFTNSEINNKIFEIKGLINKADNINKSLNINYSDFDSSSLENAYHIASNIDFYGGLQIYVFSEESVIVKAYTDIYKVLPYLREFSKHRIASRDQLISQELFSVYKDILKNVENPKGWFIAGVLLASGRIEQELKKFNQNFTSLSKELFGENTNKIRPYLTTSYNNSKGDKNIFRYPEKLKTIMEYCNKNNVQISTSFKKNSQLLD